MYYYSWGHYVYFDSWNNSRKSGDKNKNEQIESDLYKHEPH